VLIFAEKRAPCIEAVDTHPVVAVGACTIIYIAFAIGALPAGFTHAPMLDDTVNAPVTSLANIGVANVSNGLELVVTRAMSLVETQRARPS
jgi:hypothetical protein